MNECLVRNVSNMGVSLNVLISLLSLSNYKSLKRFSFFVNYRVNAFDLCQCYIQYFV